MNLNLHSTCVIVITVVVVAKNMNDSEEQKQEEETDCKMQNIYDEMLKIVAKNNMYYNKMNRHIFTSNSTKYTASSPIPIPYK